MKNVFINCSAKEFYEVLKPLLLTLEGYTMESDEWLPNDRGCLIDYEGSFYPHYQKAYEEIDIADFIEAVKPKEEPKPTVDLRNRFIPCAEEQVDEVCDLLDALGCSKWDSPFADWIEEWSVGVYVDSESVYFCTQNNDFPTLTVEELREIYKKQLTNGAI